MNNNIVLNTPYGVIYEGIAINEYIFKDNYITLEFYVNSIDTPIDKNIKIPLIYKEILKLFVYGTQLEYTSPRFTAKYMPLVAELVTLLRINNKLDII